MSTCQCGCIRLVTIPCFAGEKVAMNEYDEYVAAIAAIDNFKREEVVRHVPFFLSKTLKKFLRLHRSYASCKVTGTRINRGVGVGLEIPINTNTFCWE